MSDKPDESSNENFEGNAAIGKEAAEKMLVELYSASEMKQGKAACAAGKPVTIQREHRVVDHIDCDPITGTIKSIDRSYSDGRVNHVDYDSHGHMLLSTNVHKDGMSGATVSDMLWPDGTTKYESSDGRGMVTKTDNAGNLITHSWGPKPEENYDNITSPDGTRSIKYIDGSQYSIQSDSFVEQNPRYAESTSLDGAVIRSYADGTSYVRRSDKNGGFTEDHKGPQAKQNYRVTALADGTERVEYNDGSGYIQRPDGQGGFKQECWGPRPEGNFTKTPARDAKTVVLASQDNRPALSPGGLSYPFAKVEAGLHQRAGNNVIDLGQARDPNEIVDKLLDQARSRGNLLGDVQLDTHGSENGTIYLGNTPYALDDPRILEAFSKLKGHFAPGSRLIFGGCSVASGDKAAEKLQHLADAAGVTVEAYKLPQVGIMRWQMILVNPLLDILDKVERDPH